MHSAATASISFCERAAHATRAPSCANRSAHARPTPRPAPVTKTVRVMARQSAFWNRETSAGSGGRCLSSTLSTWEVPARSRCGAHRAPPNAPRARALAVGPKALAPAGTTSVGDVSVSDSFYLLGALSALRDGSRGRGCRKVDTKVACDRPAKPRDPAAIALCALSPSPNLTNCHGKDL